MEEKRHVCKLCSKRFPCGRSLGGHMRSHVVFSNNDNNSDQTVDYKNIQMKLNSSSDCLVGETGYRLRENPRRTFRFEYEDEQDDEDEENTFDLKMCKECGRGFQSWKALFGHMKCHSDKVHLFEEHSSSWTNNNNNNNNNSSQLYNDTSALQTPYTRKISRRKRRRTTRYTADSTTTTNSSSLSLANYASSSVSNQIDQEQQQEVALCLMMLSRDVTNWLCVNSDEDSFDQYDHLAHDGHSVFDSRNRFKMKKQVEELGSTNKHNSSKRRLREADLVVKTSYYDDLGSGYPETPYKSNKFKCTTCNKIFCSYQALGGHRASHKKTKGCSVSVSKRESSENSIEIILIQNGDKNSIEGSEVSNGKLEKPKMVSKKLSSSGMKLYECPICLKVFTSGQALGGHKRSHLVHSSEPKYGHDHDHDHEDIVIQNKDHEFIDLNLPAPAPDEEENYNINGQVGLKLKPWWIASRLSVRL